MDELRAFAGVVTGIAVGAVLWLLIGILVWRIAQ